MFQSPGPILFTLGPLTVRWYGVMIALGFLAATWAASKMAKRWGIGSENLINTALIAFLGGIIGARLYFVALSWHYFSWHTGEILATWNGGLSIHGGLIGGLIAGLIYGKLNKLPVVTYCDIFGTATALGQAIGRWGNFFNSEAFGKPAPLDYPLKLFIPAQSRPIGYENVDYFHPTFLYESLWDLTIFAVLYFFLADKLRPYPGMTFLVYVASYSIGRMLIETLRTDSIMAFNWPVPILACIAALVLSLGGIVVILLRKRAASPSQ